jgi:hypothetical protein
MPPIWVMHLLPLAQRLLHSRNSQLIRRCRSSHARKLHPVGKSDFNRSWSISPFPCNLTLKAYPCLDSIEMNWQLSYSGYSPLKYFSDFLVPLELVPYNENDYKKTIGTRQSRTDKRASVSQGSTTTRSQF